MSLLTRDYDFTLPEALIARHPLPRREDSRMLVLHRAQRRVEHTSFRDLPRFLTPRDLLVLNNTRVIPARVFTDDGRTELLFLEAAGERTWKCLVKPGRRMREGRSIRVGGVAGTVTEVLPTGERLVRFAAPIDLQTVGQIPLSPYFAREPEPGDRERYQTVYATAPGAVAAPTAGLHFTPGLLARLPHAFVTLHVGAGTFRPVQAEQITDHVMHRERYAIAPEAAGPINDRLQAQDGRIVAVGTTSVRVLESRLREPETAGENEPSGNAEHVKHAPHASPLRPGESSTDIFIHPGFAFRATGALLTNFHLPKSTLLMLVSAFAGAALPRPDEGRQLVLHAYAEAIRKRYRFYSYGDCMLLV